MEGGKGHGEEMSWEQRGDAEAGMGEGLQEEGS